MRIAVGMERGGNAEATQWQRKVCGAIAILNQWLCAAEAARGIAVVQCIRGTAMLDDQRPGPPPSLALIVVR